MRTGRNWTANLGSAGERIVETDNLTAHFSRVNADSSPGASFILTEDEENFANRSLQVQQDAESDMETEGCNS